MSEPEYISISLDQHIDWLLDDIESVKRHLARIKGEYDDARQAGEAELRLLRADLVDAYEEYYKERHGS